jgi:hypothetical protein
VMKPVSDNYCISGELEILIARTIFLISYIIIAPNYHQVMKIQVSINVINCKSAIKYKACSI